MLVPISLAYAMDDVQGELREGGVSVVFPRQIFHLFLVGGLFLWYGVTLVLSGALYWAHANKNEAGNYQNPANDPRFCCVFHSAGPDPTTPDFPCPADLECLEGVGESDLRINPVFQFQFFYTAVLLIALIVDLLLVICLMMPAYKEYVLRRQKQDPLAKADSLTRKINK